MRIPTLLWLIQSLRTAGRSRTRRRNRLGNHAHVPEALEARLLLAAAPIDDTTPPTVSIQSLSGTATSQTTVAWRFDFSEPVNGFDQLALFAATTGQVELHQPLTITEVPNSGRQSFTVRASGITGSGTIGVRFVVGQGVSDDSGNSLVSPPQLPIITIDNIRPTYQSAPVNQDTATAAPIEFRLTFSEPVTGFDANDLVVQSDVGITGHATLNLTQLPDTSWRVIVNGVQGEGEIGVALTANSGIQDAVSLPLNTAASTVTNAQMDSVAPSLAVERGSANPVTSSTVDFVLRFTESVTGVTADSFAVDGTGSVDGSLASVQIIPTSSPLVYTARVTGVAGSGTVGIAPKATANIRDIAGNALSPTLLLSERFDVDTVAPTLQVLRDGDNPATSSPVRFQLAFAEPVQGVTADDFVVNTTGTLNASATAVRLSETGDPSIYSVEVSGLSGVGTVGLSARSQTDIADLVGHPLNVGGLEEVFNFDNEEPAFQIRRAAQNPTRDTSVRWVVAFSEPIQSATAADFLLVTTGTLVGSQNDVTLEATEQPTVYIATASNLSGEGTAALQLSPTAIIVDESGVPLRRQPIANEAYDVDTVAPEMTLSAAHSEPATDGNAVFDVLFTEPITDFDAADLKLSATGTVNVEGLSLRVGNASDNDPHTYRVEVTGLTGSGELTLTTADTVTTFDEAGNLLLDTNPLATCNVHVPHAEVAILPLGQNPTREDVVRFELTFDQDVFDLSATSLSSVVRGTVTTEFLTLSDGDDADARTYVATVHGVSGDGELSVQFDDSAVVKNQSGAEISVTVQSMEFVQIDNTAPTATISPDGQVDGSTVSDIPSSVRFRVSLSESLRQLTDADFAVSSSGTLTVGAANIQSHDENTYIVDVPIVAGHGEVQLQFADDALITDQAGNPLALLNSTPHVIDAERPRFSVTRSDANPTGGPQLTFDIRFSQTVTGIDAHDFSVKLEGSVTGVLGDLTDAGDDNVRTWQLTVNQVAGNGTVGLVLTEAHDMVGEADQPLNPVPLTNEQYLVQSETVESAGTLLAYDGFDYEPGQRLLGQDGGFGWGSPWQTAEGNQANFVSANDQPLTTDGTLTDGYAHLDWHGEMRNHLTRVVDEPFGYDNTTRYFSLMLRFDEETPVADDGGIGFMFDNVSWHELAASGLPGGNWRLSQSFGRGRANSDVPTVKDEVTLLVLKAEFLPGNDIYSLYVNPTSPLDTPAVVKSDYDSPITTDLTIRAVCPGTQVDFDEFRMGTSFESVISGYTRVNAEIPTAESDDDRITFDVTFDQPVTGVEPSDFQVISSGDVSVESITVVPIDDSGMHFQAMLNQTEGTGLIDLQFSDQPTLFGLAGQPVVAARTEFRRVEKTDSSGGRLIAYEGFNYEPNQLLVERDGGDGFAAEWQQWARRKLTAYQTAADSLSFQNLKTSGGHLEVTPDSSWDAISRPLKESFGYDDTTVYFSVLMDRPLSQSDDDLRQFQFLKFEETSGSDLFIGAFDDPRFTLQSRFPTREAVYANPPQTETVLMVVKAEFFAGNDRFTLYVNPIPGQPEPESGAVKDDYNMQIATGLSFLTPNTGAFDELRVGTTFESVTPIESRVSAFAIPPLGPKTSATTVPFDITFSEPVSNIDPSDFRVVASDGLTASSSLVLTNGDDDNPLTFRLTAEDVSGNGHLSIALSDNATFSTADGDIDDIGWASTGTDVDQTPPTLAAYRRWDAVTDKTYFVFDLLFSEPVFELDESDFAVPDGGTVLSLRDRNDNNATTWTLVLGAREVDRIEVSIADDANVVDAVGNALSRTLTHSEHYERPPAQPAPPEVTITGGTMDSDRVAWWSEDEDVASYEVSIDRNDGLNIYRNPHFTGNEIGISPQAPIGFYSVTVRALMKSGYLTDPNLQAFIINRQPESPQTTESSTISRPAISWPAVHGAATYRVFVTNHTTQQSGFIDRLVSGTDFTPAADFSVGSYTFWIRAHGVEGFTSVWSAPMRHIIRPQLDSLLTSTFETQPELTWGATDSAATWEIYLRNGQTIIHEKGLSSPTWTPPEPLNSGSWNWWVRPVTAAGVQGPWSERANLSTAGRPTILAVESPEDSIVPRLSINSVGQASEYEVYLYSQEERRVLLRQRGLTTESIALAPLRPGAYQIWVRSFGPDGTAGRWSHKFEFDQEPATAGVNVTAVNDSVTSFAQPVTLQWQADSTASSYDVYVRNVVDPTMTASVTNVTSTSWLPPVDATGQWEWWVRGRDAQGVAGDWSSPGKVNFNARTVVSVSDEVSDDSTIRWTAVGGAVRYLIHINDVAAGTRLILEDVSAQTIEYVFSSLETSGSYRVWVRAIGAGNQLGPWSHRVDF